MNKDMPKLSRTRLARLGRILLTPLLDLLYIASGLVPRNHRIWVFGSGDGKSFADNPRWLFLHSLRRKDGLIRSVWISRNPSLVKRLKSEGLPAHNALSLRGLWYSLRGGVYIFNVYPGDINPWTWRGAIRVNLWHGIPLKKLGDEVEIPGHPIYKRRHGTPLEKLFWRMRTPWLDSRDDLVVGTSRYTSRLFSKVFVIPEGNVPVTGYPRNDVLTQKDYEPTIWESSLFHDIESQKKLGRRVVVYMPTYRDQTYEKRPLPMNWEILDTFLQHHNTLLVLKLHMADKVALPLLDSLRNVMQVPDELDVYPLLRLADILITDYSSVYFDFLLLNRPIIFYAHDLEDYLLKHRSMFFNYETITPGPKVKSFEELTAVLGAILKDSNAYFSSWSHKRDEIQRRFHGHLDANSCERVWKEVYTRYVLNA